MPRLHLSLLVLVAAAVGSLMLFRPSWATPAGLDWWNLPELERQFEAEHRRAENLAWQDTIVLQRIQAKNQILADLLVGRISLFQAAAEFRRLTSDPYDFPGYPPVYFPGGSEEERYCRQVLLWLYVETAEWTPSRAETLRSRLEAELDEHLNTHGGKVVLPEM